VAKRRKVSNLLALAVLSYLVQRPMHPYELGRTLKENGDARSIKFNHGSLYMVVEQLAKAGFVTALETVREGQRPERTVYALTDAGRAELYDWMRELVAEPQTEYPSFVSALSLVAVLPPDEVRRLLVARQAALAEVAAELRDGVERNLAAGLAPLFLVEEEYRIELVATEQRFVARLIERIDDPAFSGGWRDYHRRHHPTAAT
jgi:DNA-binding PadR family transcriptional regulator